MDKQPLKSIETNVSSKASNIPPLLEGVYENKPVNSIPNSYLTIIDMVEPRFKRDTILERDQNYRLLNVFSFDGFTISLNHGKKKPEANEIVGLNKIPRKFDYNADHELISATDSRGNAFHRGSDNLWYDKNDNLVANKIKMDLSGYPQYNFASLIIDKTDGTREVHNPSGSSVTFMGKKQIRAFRTPDGRDYEFDYSGKVLNHVKINNSIECTKLSGGGFGNHQEWEIKDASGTRAYSGKLRMISLDNASITHDYGFGTLEWLTPSGKPHRIDHNNGTTVYFENGVPEHIRYQDGRQVKLNLSSSFFSTKINSFTDKDGYNYTPDPSTKNQWLVTKDINNPDGSKQTLHTTWQGKITFEDAPFSDYGFGTIILWPKQGKVKRDNQLHIPTGIPALFNYGRFLNSAGG